MAREFGSAPNLARRLTVLTLNFGAEQVFERGSGSQSEWMHCLKALPAWFVYINDLIPGAVEFELSKFPNEAKRPAVVAFGCWEGDADLVWRKTIAAYLALRPILHPADLWREPTTKTPPLPWLATILIPEVASLLPYENLRLGPLARAVMWTLIQ